MSTCATCRHGLPVDPKGIWRGERAKVWETHVHCAYDKRPHVSITPMKNECWYVPSKWEAK